MVTRLTSVVLALLMVWLLAGCATNGVQAADERTDENMKADVGHSLTMAWRYLLANRKSLHQSNFPIHFSEESLEVIAKTLFNGLPLKISVQPIIGECVIADYVPSDTLYRSIEELVVLAGCSWHLGRDRVFLDAAHGISDDPLIRRKYVAPVGAEQSFGRPTEEALHAWLAASLPGIGFVSCAWSSDGSLSVTTFAFSQERVARQLSVVGFANQ